MGSPSSSVSNWLGYRAPLLAGDQGIQQTVELMRRLIDEALSNSDFVNLAVRIVGTAPAYQDLGEAEALYNWVKRNIRFTKDPVTKEKLTPPRELLKLRAGDCDDISMLLGGFLLAVGYPARLITLAANPTQPGEFSHVYVEGEVPPGSGNWVPMDAARVDSQFGVAPPNYFRKRAWSLTDNSYQDLSGAKSHVHANTISGLGCTPGCGCGARKNLSGLGVYSRDAFFMPAGARLNGMGQDQVLVSQALAEMPALISVSSGTPGYSSTPYGTFQTSMSPGYGIPAAGYFGAQGTPFVSSSSSMTPLLLLGGLALVVMMMGRK